MVQSFHLKQLSSGVSININDTQAGCQGETKV